MKDFFEGIKDRFKNPFFSTFVIVWIYNNWEIIVALFFESESLITSNGYKNRISYIEKISSDKTQWDLFYFPLLLAMAYQFLFLPVVLIGIKNFIFEYSKRISDNLISKWGTNSGLSVPVERIYEERRVLDKTKRDYRLAIESEKKYRVDYEKLEQNYSELNNQYNFAREKYMKDLSLYDITYMNDFWKNTWTYSDKSKPESEYLRIENGTIFKYRNSIEDYVYGEIVNFKTDENRTKISFVKIISGNRNVYNNKLNEDELKKSNKPIALYNDLKSDQTGTLIGKENTNIDIKLQRIDSSEIQDYFRNKSSQ